MKEYTSGNGHPYTGRCPHPDVGKASLEVGRPVGPLEPIRDQIRTVFGDAVPSGIGGFDSVSHDVSGG
jgi:hypothetical protein